MRFECEHPFHCVEGIVTGKAYFLQETRLILSASIGEMEGEKEKPAMFHEKEFCFGILLEEKQTCDLMTLYILSLLR